MLSDEQYICFHEASHALVCDALGGEVTRIELTSAGGGVTGVIVKDDKPDDYATVLAAGGAGEFFAAQWHQYDASREQYLYLSTGRGDLATFRTVKTVLTWEAAFNRAYEILSKKPTRLFALAAQLERRGYIDGSDFRATMPVLDAIVNRALTGGRSRAGMIRQQIRKWSEL